MTLESFTQGERQGMVDLDVPSLFIKVGARAPEPFGPWHPAHPFCTKSCAPSLAVPLPDEGLVGVTFKPLHSGLPIREGSPCIAVWHLHLRQTLGVHYRVLRDDTVFVEQKGRQRVDLIGGEGSLSVERH